VECRWWHRPWVDLVDHGRTGLLHDPADKRVLRRAVVTLAGGTELRASTAGRALGEVAQRSWAAVVRLCREVPFTDTEVARARSCTV
jgi:hypothetical protein